jgi:hypothetical protein
MTINAAVFLSPPGERIKVRGQPDREKISVTPHYN